MGCCASASSPETEEVPKRNFVKQSGCTDVICLVIFAIFISVLIFISAFAFVYGSPQKLINGYDSFGNICGAKGTPLGNMSLTGLDMRHRKYVFFLNVTDVFRSLKLCVSHCPDVDIEERVVLKHYALKWNTQLCRYDIPIDRYDQPFPFGNTDAITSLPSHQQEEISKVSWNLVCPSFPVYKSVPVLNRCVPKGTNRLGFQMISSIHAYLNNVEVFQQIFSDFYASWDKILGLTSAAFVLSFVVTIFMYCFTFILSWIFMITLAAASLGCTAVLWYAYATSRRQLDNTPQEELLEESVRNEQAFLVFSTLATIFTVVLLLVMFYLRKHIRLLTDLFREAGYCIRDIPCLLLQPLWTSLALNTFFVLWTSVMVALATADIPAKTNGTHPLIRHSPISNTTKLAMGVPGNVTLSEFSAPMTVIKYYPTWVQYTWWFFVFALVWVSEFILACQQMVIAGATCFWYFERKNQQKSFPICKAFRHLVLYHMGSLALGSFLITIIKIPRLILTYMEERLKKYKDTDTCSSMAHCCLKCCSCCLWCLQKFMKYVNHNAYTIIVYKGESFCPSAKIAFDTIMSNIFKVTVINSVGDAILFFGKCAITAIIGGIGLLLMMNDENLHFYAIPIFVVCVFTFFIAHCFLSVFEMVVDTLLLCFCEDFSREVGDGDVEPKHYASESLRLYLERACDELNQKVRTDGDGTNGKDTHRPANEPEGNEDAMMIPPSDPLMDPMESLESQIIQDESGNLLYSTDQSQERRSPGVGIGSGSRGAGVVTFATKDPVSQDPPQHLQHLQHLQQLQQHPSGAEANDEDYVDDYGEEGVDEQMEQESEPDMVTEEQQVSDDEVEGKMRF